MMLIMICLIKKSLSVEFRARGLEKWLRIFRLHFHHVACTPRRPWVLFIFVFIVETVIVGHFCLKTVEVVGATHQQFEFGRAVFLLSLVICSIMAFLRSLQAEDMVMTTKPRKFGLMAWLMSTNCRSSTAFLERVICSSRFVFNHSTHGCIPFCRHSYLDP